MRPMRLPASGLVALGAAWLTLVGNGVLWQRLMTLPMLGPAQRALLVLVVALLLWCALVLLLSPFVWRATLKPALTVLLLVGALASHFMASYGVVVDPGMATNVLQTDPREAAALLDWRLAATLAWMAGLPLLWLWRCAPRYGRARQRLGHNLLLALGAAALLGAVGLAGFAPLASLMRNHKDVRYLLNPLASVYAFTRAAAATPARHAGAPPAAFGEDAQLAPTARPRLLLLVLGETARAGHFGLNGYGRATTPQLQQEDVASWRNAWSCGTSTAASLPCMFSGHTREQFDAAAAPREGLLDVLQHAGLAVLWIDNQAGCKGVCDRVAQVRAGPCASGECFDDALLDGLDERIAALDAQRRARGIVLVMHPMGSHGPAYYQRSPAAFKRFLPECSSAALQTCSRDGVVNAYDNSIVYTDHVLARAIGWLKTKAGAYDTAMLYVADHGESLGEGNLYLHGMPYALAPDVQKRVPWITWASAGWQQDSGLSMDCLRRQRDLRVSHDHFFHAVLGLMDVRSKVYDAALDPYAACRREP